MTAVLDPGALLNAGPGHYIGEFFGVGGLDMASSRHRQHAGRWATHPALWSPVAGTFLARAVAVEWAPPALNVVNAPHFYHAALTLSQAQQSPDAGNVGGSWLADSDPYVSWGHGWAAMAEDDDRAPYEAPKTSDTPLILAGLALAVLIIVACCMTDGGGF